MKSVVALCLLLLMLTSACTAKKEVAFTQADSLWHAPDTATIPNDLTRYGRKLVANTSFYLGPKGIVDSISNGMNCQNCHMDAGTKPFGNNFGSVASLYPKFRARSGAIESIERRVNDCIQRSLNGTPLDSLSKEMRALVAYISWVGHKVPKGTSANGSGLIQLKFLNRSADTVRGKKQYEKQCRACHKTNGQGMFASNKKSYIYPPLWGAHSFNTGAGLFRMSNFARYIRANMPHGATYDRPVLTEEESWDIAAYVLSMPRPKKEFKRDWPKIETKPFDHPFGPYADSLSEMAHKYGPWKIPK